MKNITRIETFAEAALGSVILIRVLMITNLVGVIHDMHRFLLLKLTFLLKHLLKSSLSLCSPCSLSISFSVIVYYMQPCPSVFPKLYLNTFRCCLSEPSSLLFFSWISKTFLFNLHPMCILYFYSLSFKIQIWTNHKLIILPVLSSMLCSAISWDLFIPQLVANLLSCIVHLYDL